MEVGCLYHVIVHGMNATIRYTLYASPTRSQDFGVNRTIDRVHRIYKWGPGVEDVVLEGN